MAPNRFAAVEVIAAVVRPNLTTHEGADHFTAQVAATLHFGSAAIGIAPDANWGRRRNPSGILSDDVIQYRSSGENFDIIPGAGSSSARPGWAPSTPGPWVAPEQDDVVGGSAPPVTPTPTPTPAPAPTIDLSEVLTILNAIAVTQHELRAQLEAIHGEMARADRLDDIVHTSRNEHNEKLDALLQRPAPERCRSRFGF